MYDVRRLLFRNFPSNFTEKDIHEFLLMFDATDIQINFQHRSAAAIFKNDQHARDVLKLLHQVVLDGKLLFVEYASKNFQQSHSDRPNTSDTESTSHKNVEQMNINETIKRLYATADNLDFNQPPAPYLRYEYPLINRDIIDSISIALESSEKFYIQVLHLMNRMNLEPPFVPGDVKLKYANTGKTPLKPINRTCSTQTDEIIWQNLIRNKRKRLASDESEIDSSDSDSSSALNKKLISDKTKRAKVVKNTKLAKRNHQKQLKMQRLQQEMVQHKPITTNVNINDAFELSQNLSKSVNITIVPPMQLQTIEEHVDQSIPRTNVDIIHSASTESIEHSTTTMPTIVRDTQNSDLSANATPVEDAAIQSDIRILTSAELNENRLPKDQLETHPLFQNYESGEITNRLYIKNIAKEVTEDDLKAIYYRYLEKNCDGIGNIGSIDIRLMKTGRMKGQAFITFSGPYLDIDDSTGSESDNKRKYQMVEKALLETNGYILKNKVLVVMYGKKKMK